MGKLIRYMISLTAPQFDWLQSEADRLGVSVPELVRRIVDEKRGSR